jgi:uncharacterized membrane protein
MTTPHKTFFALVGVTIALTVYYYAQLPDTVASHFDGAGHPNGWSSKPMFFGVMFGMIALMGAVFLYLPKSFARMPRNLISLPYRDHWLSDENRGETIRFIEYQFAWFGVATLLLILATIQFTIDANLSPNHHLPNRFMWVFWAYMAFTAVWTVRFVAHFARIRGRHESMSN